MPNSSARTRVAALAAVTLACAASLGFYALPEPAPPATPTRDYPVRGIYMRDDSATGFDHEAALGFNAIDSGPYVEELDALGRRGLTAIVWLGPYSNERCAFQHGDDWVKSKVAAIAGRSEVAAYFIDDEPDASTCPDAPAQIKARAALVKRLDPRPPTLVVLYKPEQLRMFAGTVDVIGLDHYPCSIKNGCDYSKIIDQAEQADRLGIRYWGVIQAYGDDWYKLPTPDELHAQFVFWRATNMEGYLVFAWKWPPDSPHLWLANHPPLQAQLARENAASTPRSR